MPEIEYSLSESYTAPCFAVYATKIKSTLNECSIKSFNFNGDRKIILQNLIAYECYFACKYSQSSDFEIFGIRMTYSRLTPNVINRELMKINKNHPKTLSVSVYNRNAKSTYSYFRFSFEELPLRIRLEAGRCPVLDTYKIYAHVSSEVESGNYLVKYLVGKSRDSAHPHHSNHLNLELRSEPITVIESSTNTAPTCVDHTVTPYRVPLGEIIQFSVIGSDIDLEPKDLEYLIEEYPMVGNITFWDTATEYLYYSTCLNDKLGTYTFKYKTFDGTAYSSACTVSLTIVDNIKPPACRYGGRIHNVHSIIYDSSIYIGERAWTNSYSVSQLNSYNGYNVVFDRPELVQDYYFETNVLKTGTLTLTFTKDNLYKSIECTEVYQFSFPPIIENNDRIIVQGLTKIIAFQAIDDDNTIYNEKCYLYNELKSKGTIVHDNNNNRCNVNYTVPH